MNISLTPDRLKQIADTRRPGLKFLILTYDTILQRGIPDTNCIIHYPQDIEFIGKQKIISGHYVCLLKTPDTHTRYFYDPYGELPDKHKVDLDHPQKHLLYNRKLNHRNLMGQLIDGSRMVDYSPYNHQRFSNTIATCGRHCIVRLSKHRMTNDQYHQWLTQKFRKSNQPSYDHLVYELTS